MISYLNKLNRNDSNIITTPIPATTYPIEGNINNNITPMAPIAIPIFAKVFIEFYFFMDYT